MATPDTRIQFNQISALIKNQEMAQALALLKPILIKEPQNVEGWWLAANAAPTPQASRVSTASRRPGPECFAGPSIARDTRPRPRVAATGAGSGTKRG